MKCSRPIVASAVAAVLGVSPPAVAQQHASCPPVTGEVYLLCQVDTPARPDPRNARPRYPDLLLQAGVGGTVRVKFVVDTTGRVAPGAGFQVLASSHDIFTFAVRQAVRGWSFEPGLKSGRPVMVWFEQVFDFNTPPNVDDPSAATVVVQADTTDGVPRMLVGTRGRDPAVASSFTPSDLLDAQRATLVSLAPRPIADSAGRPRVTVCLTVIRDGLAVPGDSAALAALNAPGRRAVVPRDCPRTYASMIYDPKKRTPPGWIDPYAMVVTHVVPWNAETVLIGAEVEQGTGTLLYRCTVTRDAAAWRPACRHHGGRISQATPSTQHATHSGNHDT